VIEVEELTAKLSAGVLPKMTPTTSVKLVPLMVTLVPPAVLPVFGEMLVTEGVWGVELTTTRLTLVLLY
jgi:hypothetical protein